MMCQKNRASYYYTRYYLMRDCEAQNAFGHNFVMQHITTMVKKISGFLSDFAYNLYYYINTNSLIGRARHTIVKNNYSTHPPHRKQHLIYKLEVYDYLRSSLTCFDKNGGHFTLYIVFLPFCFFEYSYLFFFLNYFFSLFLYKYCIKKNFPKKYT